MTKKERQEYSAKYSRRIKLFERQYTKAVYNAVRSQILDFTADIKANGLDDATKRMEFVLMNDKIGHVIKDIYKTVGVFYANQKLREVNKSAKQVKGFGFNLEWIVELVNYFKLFLLNKAVIPITETTKEQMRQLLITGQKNGWGIDQIVRGLESSELTLWRARMIARTEIGKAAFKGREMGKAKSEFQLVNEWIAANDHRTRHSHREVDGDMVDEGKTFKVPIYRHDTKEKRGALIGYDEMIGPNDPNGSKGNIINCRCTDSSRVKFDENGRAVRKNKFVI